MLRDLDEPVDGLIVASPSNPAGSMIDVETYRELATYCRENGIRLIEENGPYEIKGDASIMAPLDRLLQAFVEQHRMKLPGGTAYEPCYRVVT